MSIPRRLDADDIVRLRFLAAEFDAEADGGCWPASRFVQWIEQSLNDQGAGARPAGEHVRRRREGNGH